MTSQLAACLYRIIQCLFVFPAADKITMFSLFANESRTLKGSTADADVFVVKHEGKPDDVFRLN